MNRLTTLFISNTFSLDRDLNEPIMIDLLYEGDPDLVLSTTNLTFTRLTWSQPQKISISVALDADTVNRAGVIILTALRGRKS